MTKLENNFLIKIALCGLFLTNCSKKEEASESSPSNFAIAGELKNAAGTLVAGEYKMTCLNAANATERCEVSIKDGVFSGSCNALYAKGLSCYLSESDKVLSPVYFKNSIIFNPNAESLNLALTYDSKSGIIDATFVSKDDANDSIYGNWDQFFDSSDGFELDLTCANANRLANAYGQTGCAAQSPYFVSLGGSTFEWWQSQSHFRACYPDGRNEPMKAKFVLSAAKTSTVDTGSETGFFNSLKSGIRAFLSEAPEALNTAIETVADSRQDDLQEYFDNISLAGTLTNFKPTVRADDTVTRLVFDLLSLTNEEVSQAATYCAIKSEKAAYLASTGFKVSEAMDVLCNVPTSDIAAVQTWLTTVSAASCLPIVYWDSSFQSTTQKITTNQSCLGEHGGAQCFDSQNKFLGRVAGKVATFDAKQAGDTLSFADSMIFESKIVKSDGSEGKCYFGKRIGFSGSGNSSSLNGILSVQPVNTCTQMGSEIDFGALENSSSSARSRIYDVTLKAK